MSLRAVLLAGAAVAACAVTVGTLSGGGTDAPMPGAVDGPLTRALRAGTVGRAPPALRRACARIAATAVLPVRCPSVLPENGGGFERPRTFDVERCAYLVDLEPRGVRTARGTLFHVLFGGRCAPLPLAVRGGRWPASALGRTDLRLVGSRPLVPGGGGGERVQLNVLARTTVGGAPALLLQSPGYPLGGIHGGHAVLVWNAGGHGYAVTAHEAGVSDEGNGSLPPPRQRTLAVLRAVAAGMRPVR